MYIHIYAYIYIDIIQGHESNDGKMMDISIQIRVALFTKQLQQPSAMPAMPQITRRSGKTTRSEWPASYKKTVEDWLVRSDGSPAADSQRVEPEVEAGWGCYAGKVRSQMTCGRTTFVCSEFKYSLADRPQFSIILPRIHFYHVPFLPRIARLHFFRSFQLAFWE